MKEKIFKILDELLSGSHPAFSRNDLLSNTAEIIYSEFCRANGPWLIWSHEHKAWWCAGHNGYTTVAKDAGRYSYDEALGIVSRANYSLVKGFSDEPNEAMILDTFPKE
jgi:hypothetical protein